MPEKRISSCSRAWPIPPPPPPPPWQSPRSSPSPISKLHHRRLLLLLLSHLCLLFRWHRRRQFQRLRLPHLSSFCRQIPLELRWPNGGLPNPWDQVGCHSPKQLPGTTGRKWRRSRGAVSSGRGTPGVQSPKADSVGSSVKMANIASNKATGNCPNTATVSFEDRERKRLKNPWADLSAPNPDLVTTVQRYCVPPRTTFTAKIKTVPTSS